MFVIKKKIDFTFKISSVGGQMQQMQGGMYCLNKSDILFLRNISLLRSPRQSNITSKVSKEGKCL